VTPGRRVGSPKRFARREAKPSSRPACLENRQAGFRVEVADIVNSPAWAEKVAMELHDLLVGHRLHALDGFLDRRHVADVVAGIRIELALQQAGASMAGSVFICSKPARRSRFIT
jgi:hypothetical protein